MLCVLVLGGFFAGGVMHACDAAAATASAEAVAWLNAQRVANGLPSGIVDEPSWDVACEHHVNWLHLNPDRATAEEQHDEVPGTPGYTTDGAWAGEHSVLDATFSALTSVGAEREPDYSAYPWGALDGWEWAPLHLMQLLNPALDVTGFYPGCMVTLGAASPEP
ncbi:MAG TPA: hypothetical protein VED41_12555, partial [Solirubrobacteraceae bacterium]|nr:hypothetical protein [Solirubrobacteraceae bacterium]